MDCRSLGDNNLSGLLPDLDIFHGLRKLWVSHPGNLFHLLIFIITFLMFPISTKWGEEPTLAWTSLNSILSLSGDPPQWKQVHFLLFVFCHGGLPGIWVTINLVLFIFWALIEEVNSSYGVFIVETARNLSNNQFMGPLPHSLGSLNQLTLLDLSHNNLSGTFPSTMANLTSLQQL